MLITITGARCLGIEAVPVSVEVDIHRGIGVHLVGLADTAVKESLLRTINALQSIGFSIPGKKIIINLAPADLHKKGSGYDLPIALGIISASSQMELPLLKDFMIMGELGLDGSVRSISGGLSIAELARQTGLKGCILPVASALEAAEFREFPVYGVHNISEVLEILRGEYSCEHLLVWNSEEYCRREETCGHRGQTGTDIPDFADIIGQPAAKRALEIAACGNHNAILIGSPGSGKSSLAKAMCKILPPMSMEESLQTSKIYSVAGRGNLSSGLIRERPFRAPHNTASIPALIGGGSDNISPGEVSLAHNGILFLDEFCEIPRRTIEVLRAPMEDRKIIISRLREKVEYPAAFTLIAATNPCKCGFYGEGDRCTCTVASRQAYLSKLSGPIMDRIDLQVWCKSVSARHLINHAKEESSAVVAERVAAARLIQKKRFRDDGIFCNSQMDNRLMERYCRMDRDGQTFLESAMEKTGLSARAFTRIVKLARTIADMEESTDIRTRHIAEAISYRFLDKVEQGR